jgi:hypothetical protein
MDDKYFEDLILKGAVEFSGIDSETGEMLYSFTDKLESVAPEIFEAYNEEFYRQIMYLWEKGFLDINISTQSPVVRLNPSSTDPERIKALHPMYRIVLSQIVQAFLDADGQGE